MFMNIYLYIYMCVCIYIYICMYICIQIHIYREREEVTCTASCRPWRRECPCTRSASSRLPRPPAKSDNSTCKHRVRVKHSGRFSSDRARIARDADVWMIHFSTFQTCIQQSITRDIDFWRRERFSGYGVQQHAIMLWMQGLRFRVSGWGCRV